MNHPNSPAWAEPVSPLAIARGLPCEFCYLPGFDDPRPAPPHRFSCPALMVDRAIDDAFLADPRLEFPWLPA